MSRHSRYPEARRAEIRYGDVFLHGTEQQLGTVRPAGQLWEALDLSGQSHGNTWLTEYWAADALTRAPLRATITS